MKMSVFKKFFMLLIALSFGLSVQTFAQFQSDSQIKRNFDSDISDANVAIRNIESVAQADSLLDVINNIPSKFGNDRELLNRVYFPRTVEGIVDDLRSLAQSTRERIRRIEEQGENVIVLEQRLEELRDNVAERNEELERLQNDLQQMTRSRNQASARARSYQNAMRERDEFILELIDSIYVAYERVDLSTLSASEVSAVALEIDPDNVFGYIESVVANNRDFLDTHTQLSSEDFLRLYAVQAEFRRMWENLGSKLSELYVDENRSQRVRAIANEIGEWGSQIDDTVWESVRAVFEQRDIDLGNFNSSVSFNMAVINYLDEAIERAREGGSEEEYALYQNFASVWNEEIKLNWQEYMINAELMNHRDFAGIDRQLAEWKVLSQPQSYASLMYLGLSLVVILILIVLYVRERSKNKSRA